MLDPAPSTPWAGHIAAILLALVSLGCALFAAEWVVVSSIFSAPDAASVVPLLPSLLAAFGAWSGWTRCHARGLRFDAADAAFKALVILSVLLTAASFVAFAHGVLYPPPSLDFGFGLGGC
ncbi:MAG: hypothetical protein ABIP39_03805 [Polyangiaceae bacterium]